MKLRRVNKSKIKRNISSAIGMLLIIVSIIALGLEGIAHARDSWGDDGGGSSATQTCGSGNCQTIRTTGAFWVVFQSPANHFSSSQFGFALNVYTDSMDCKAGANVYVLVNRLSRSGFAGIIGANEVISRGQYIHDYDGGTVPAGSRGISASEALAAYNNSGTHEYRYTSAKGSSGDNIGWFCGEKISTTTTRTYTTTEPTFTCPDSYIREYGRTTTRIAVKNKSLGDGWKASGKRSGLPSDSGWTDGGGEFYTIAKPGDSIQFLHAVCMQDRYARRTSTQDSWTSSEGHGTIYNIPAQSFTIGASPSYYAFGNGIDVVNSQSQGVTAYEGWYSSRGQAGVKVDGGRYGIQTTSPTPDNNDYDCDAVAQYASKDPYIKNASFHIPGFSSGESCNSASKTRSNTVGKTITQYHKFDSMKVWETMYHSTSGSCSCGNNSAVLNWNRTATNYHGGTNGHRRLYACGPKGSNNCNWTCDNCCDKYGNCISGSYKDYNYPYKDGSFDFMYHTTHKNTSETKTARVYVPYNFETNVHSEIDANDVIFQGSSVSSNFSWKIKKRSNNTTSDFAYATVTPSNTKVQMVEFILTPDAEQAIKGKKDAKKDPCAYYTAEKRGAVLCNIIDEDNGNQNPRGLYAGKTHEADYRRLVPDNDEYVGYKYCVAVGIWPSDSHDYMGNELWQQYSTGEGGAMDAGQYWNISNASCRTIAKRPSFQVWNGSIYTQGTINTSVSQKMTGKSGGEERRNNYHNGETTIFGSWTDYAIVTDDESINGISSGAVLGYHNGKYNLSGGGGIGATMISEYRDVSPMTISNSSSIGIGRVNASTSINTNLQRLNSRYRDKAKTYASDASEGAYGSQTTINTASTGTQYVYYNGSTNISSIGIRGAGSKPNQTTRREGSNLIKTIGDGVNDNTLIIYVTGDLTIDQNICLGTGCSNDPTKLRTYNTISTNASAKLPQIIIFANNVYVTQDVNRIDAWLIVPNGTIDTCKGFNIGNNLAARDAKQRYTDYGNCYKTLVVNGPIYANNIALKRTAGNNHGFAPDDNIDVLDRSLGSTGECTTDRNGNINNRYPCDATKGSVAPAEIFNLRADTYIWAYNQAERYSEAVVTYTRELAPRY